MKSFHSCLLGMCKVTAVLLTLASLTIPVWASQLCSGATAAIDNSTYINANDILMFVSNRGTYARDIGGVFGYDYGTFYPFTSVEDIISGTNTTSPLFAAGLWLGGLVGGELRVTVAEFSTEYWPGPMTAGSFDPDGDTVSAYRVYKLYIDSLEGNPNTDYLEWPASHGAPLDDQGKPLVLGSQTLWSVFNDANPAAHTHQAASTDPLGIEVQQLTWASDDIDMERIIYIQYKLYNKGSNSISDMHLGIFLDPDLGWTVDDLTGCDTLSDLFFCYNADNDDEEYGTSPPAVGAKLLYGPIVPSPSDTARFADKLLPDYRNLEMSSFISYVNGTDPQTPQECYNIMRGLLQNGNPLPNGTKFSWPGDPLTGTGDIETNPGNRHIIGSFGPINFNPGDSQYVLIKLAVGQGDNNLTSLDNLKDLLNAENLLPTASDDDIDLAIPNHFQLDQNYPNPFNAGTTISYSLPEKSRIELSIYNILGERVRILVDETEPAGTYYINWDGTDGENKTMPSGIYFYRLQAGAFSHTNRMILLK